MKEYPRINIGPMSKEIVDIVVEYGNIGLIPSRRQVEYDGGYVNGWTTDIFSKYIRSKSNDTIITRDHGGPSQGKIYDSGFDSFYFDIKSGFNILHIDPWKECKSISDAAKRTSELILFCCSLDKDVKFEVGTEESIFPYSEMELDSFLGILQNLLKDDFNRIKIAVIQSGVKISGDRNIGKFDNERLKRMVKITKKWNLLSKEHNSDYLSVDDIETRIQSGLDCFNFAPEFGVLQTKLLLKSGKINLSDAYDTCFREGKYKKWIPEEDLNPSKETIVNLSGHYCFTKSPFKNCLEEIKDELSDTIHHRLDSIFELMR